LSFLGFLGVLFLVGLVFSEGPFVVIGHMFALTVKALESMRAWFALFGF